MKMNTKNTLTQNGVRFAPSPTGDFHIGNLRTAWVSYRWAQTLGEPWIVRFEDIDRPRVRAGSRENQLHDLKTLGMIPDEIILQSQFHHRHWLAFCAAVKDKIIYPCHCSRKEVQLALGQMASAPHESPPIYSGHCRDNPQLQYPEEQQLAWRFRAHEGNGANDFIVARTVGPYKDLFLPIHETAFFPAYHWACAIDDFDGNYKLLVRCHDLQSAIVPQRAIQAWLSQPHAPQYASVFHTALVTQNDGHRLEKRTAGVTLRELLPRGWTAKKILEVFDSSFTQENFRQPVKAGLLLGETAQTISLQELTL